MSDPQTKEPGHPINIGTCLIKNADNPDFHYCFGVVELNNSAGTTEISFVGNSMHLNKQKLVYSYDYGESLPDPQLGTSNYFLDLFLPQTSIAEPQNYIIPDDIEVYNAKEPEKKIKGKVNTDAPLTDDDVNYPEYEPRLKLLQYPSTSPTSFYLFVLANTPSTAMMALNVDLSNPPTIVCTTSGGASNGPNNASAALIELPDTTTFNNVTVNGSTPEPIPYSNPNDFYFGNSSPSARDSGGGTL